MTTVSSLEELSSYVPALILRRVTADTGATTTPSVERFPAAVLLADLSGFTALTEHFAQHSPAGAEELTRILDLYFGQLVGVVMSYGGDVVKFAGDGLLALWYGTDPLRDLTRRAVQCGLAVQAMMATEVRRARDQTPPPPLKVRVGIAAGDVTTMHLGGVFGRWELLVTGEALDQCGRAESQAHSGEVVISPDAWALIAGSCLGEELASGAVRLRELVEPLPRRPLPRSAVVPAMADALRAYIPKAILARIDAGQTAWLAEQRRVSVLFINLPDLQAELPLHRAQALMRALQTSLYRYEGSITRLGTDAHGPTVVAALGLPPLAHEDDPERGVRAALGIAAAIGDLGFRAAIGVSTGRALCGAVGAPSRREYTMMGPMVNRSARLMQAAAKQSHGGAEILCDEATFRAARGRLGFEPLAPLILKGFADPVPVYRPRTVELATPAPAGHRPELLGRTRERQLIAARIDRLAHAGEGGGLIIEGEAGIGKSALLGYACTYAVGVGVTVLGGAGSPVDLPPYQAWRAVFGELIPLMARSRSLAVAAEGHAAGSGRLIGEAALDVLEELDLTAFAPLLNAVLPFSWPDTPRTRPLVGQVRADNTRDLLVRLIERAAAHRPLLIAFEDAQWLDASSWALVQAVADRVGQLLITMAMRPLPTAPPAFQRLAYLPASLRLQLHGLGTNELSELLARNLAVAEVPVPLVELIAGRSQGNPFVAEELLHALREDGALRVVDGVCRLSTSEPAELAAASSLPDTVEGLITSRIDRLTPAQQLTLKVASVIGHGFALDTLLAIHPVEHDREHLVEQLFALQQAGLVVIDSFEPELIYAFKHVVGCEVAYNLMSFSQRRRLHRALAEQFEAAGSREALAAQLAHHWRLAEEPQRAMGYLAQAGAAALRGGDYREATVFLADALALAADLATPVRSPVDDLTRASWERQLGEAYHGLGRLLESREQLEQAVARLGYPLRERHSRVVLGLLVELARQLRALLMPERLRVRAGGAAPGEAARAYALLAQLAYYDGQLLRSTYAALRGLNLAERAGRSQWLAGAYASTQLAVGALSPLARVYRRRAQAVAVDLGYLPAQGWLAEIQAIYELGHADWRRAQAALVVGLAVADHLGDQRRRAECVAIRCLIYLHQGDYQAALGGCDELQVIGARTGDVQVRAWGLIGAAENLLSQGEAERAEKLLGEAEALLAENLGGARAEEIWLYGLQGRAALRRGAHTIARARASAAAGLLGRLPPAAIYGLGGYSAIAEVYLGLLAQRPVEDAVGRAALVEVSRRACRSLTHLALVFPVARPAALTWNGLRAALMGQPAVAYRRWTRAAAIAAHQGMPYDVSRARFLLGRHLGGAEGSRLIAQAAASFERLGCAYDLREARGA